MIFLRDLLVSLWNYTEPDRFGAVKVRRSYDLVDIIRCEPEGIEARTGDKGMKKREDNRKRMRRR